MAQRLAPDLYGIAYGCLLGVFLLGTLTRNATERLACDEKLFFRVVKQAFSTRRKTLRNALKPLGLSAEAMSGELFDKRAEQLGVAQFVELTNLVAAG